MADLFYRFGTALAIGFLVGLEREFHSAEKSQKLPFAGVRTFSLLALAGCTAAMLADVAGTPWALVGPMAIVGGLIVGSYVVASREGEVGLTTEVAALVTFLVGALCYHRQVAFAIALGVAMMFLLSFKLELRRFARNLNREDIIAVVKFGVITAIVLPVLPNEGAGDPPFDVINPRNIWLMVVLIAGLNFLGYVLIKVFGQRKGIVLTGLLGGLVSSTAVTLTFSQRSRDRGMLARLFGAAVIIAWVLMFLRVLVEVTIVNRQLIGGLWLPMAAAASAGLVYSALLVRRNSGGDDTSEVEVTNPFSLASALRFGALYAGILFGARIAQLYFGDSGIYVSSVLAGFTDVDAITLSMAQLSQVGGSVEIEVATRAVVLAALANTVAKGGIVLALGHARLKRVVLPGLVAILVAGIAAISLG